MSLDEWGFSATDIDTLSGADLAEYESATAEHRDALSRLGVRHIRVALPTEPVSADSIREEAAMLRRFATQQRMSMLSEPLFGTHKRQSHVA